MKKLTLTLPVLKQRNLNLFLFVFLLITFNFFFISRAYSQSDSIIVADRFGNYFPIETIRVPVAGQGLLGGGGGLNTCTAGIFNLVFTDPFNQGFNNNTNGNVYRDVACRVFTDLSQLIIPANNPYTGASNINNPFVNVNLHLYGGGNAFIAGQGTSFYNEQFAGILFNGAMNNGLLNGEVWKTINGGFDSYAAFSNYYPFGQFFHGDVVVNFSPGFTWNLDYTIPNPAGDIDLYTVILHEAIHMLGFTSFLSATGTSNLAGTNFYTSYDTHLNIDNAGSLIPILNNPFSCGNITYSGVTFTGGCNTRFLGTNNEPVTPGNPYNLGQSFMHFEENCPPATPYVMSNGGVPGTTRRHPTQQDVYALCDLHYHTTPIYGISGTGNDNYFNTYIPCGNRIAGVDDIFHFGTSNLYIYTDCAGQTPIAMNDFLANDEDESSATGHPVSYDCLTIIRGNGVVSSPTATTFNYQTLPGFNGWSILRYIPVGQNGQRGNLTYIYILTVPCSNCNNTACNYVEFGDFEQINNSAVLPLSNFRITLNNSPDLFGWNGVNWVLYPPNGTATTWGLPCSGTVNIAPSWSGIGNNRYAGFAGLAQNNEGLTFKLCKPLKPGKQYTLSFYSTMLSTQCPGELHFYTSEYAPCLPGLGATDFAISNNCSGTVPAFNFTEIVTPQIINNVVPNWTLRTVTFTYTPVVGTPDANYLTISLTPQNYPDFPYIFVDDIAISCTPDIAETIVNPCAGQCNGWIDLTISGCSPPYSFVWSNGATSEDLTSLCPGNYTVTVTDANGCTKTKTYVLVNQSGCSPFTIIKTANVSCTYAGSPVTFTITIYNNTGSVQNGTVTDVFPMNNFTVTSANPFPNNIPTVISLLPGPNVFTITGYYSNIGQCPDPSFINTISLTALGQTYSSDVCVCILYGCPMLVFGNSDCIVNNPVSIRTSIHSGQTQVVKVEFSIVYPSFISPPTVGSLIGNITSPYPWMQFDFSTATSTAILGAPTFYYTFQGVNYYKVPLRITYLNPINLPPAYSFGDIKFIYTNNSPVRPLGQNIFLCFITSPAGGPYHVDIYTAASPTIPLTLWSQGYHVFFSGCPDAQQLDASFTVTQTPCDAHGAVTVAANYFSSTAVHIWDFGDGRSTPINGAQSYTWKYYDTYVDNNGYSQPGVAPGVYTITHTVIDNGIATIQTMNAMLYPACCAAQTKIPDGSTVTSLGYNNVSGSVDIEGKFYIDQPFTFNNATVTADPAAEIIVMPANNLDVDHTSISACSNMWTGITVQNDASTRIVFSNLADAQYAVNMNDRSTAYITNNTFERNFVGIYAAQSPIDFNNINLFVAENTFKSGGGLVAAFTGQTPAPSQKSFAGMQLYDMTLDLSNPGFQPNIFTDMSNGIVGNRLELDATNCLFSNIKNVTAYNSLTTFNGSGVTDRGGHGYFSIRQVGFGKYSAQATFDNCHYGITGQDINVFSTDNKMTNMDMDYRIDYCSYMNIDILNNYLHSKMNGIDLRYNDNAEHILVEDNEMHFGDPTLVATKGHSAIQVIEQNGDNANSIIHHNFIYYNPNSTNARNGIFLNSAANYKVTENTLTMFDNNYNPCGIYSFGSLGPEISCNFVYGSYTNYTNKYQSAITITMNTAPTVACNTVDGTVNGIYFSGASYGTDLKGNNIKTHVNGIHLDNSAIIGTQKYRGNLWYQAAIGTGVNAVYDNLLNAITYTWKVDPTIVIPGSNPVPMTSSPAGWINPLTGTNFECSQNGNYCSQFFANGGGTDNFDHQIATGNLQNNPFTDETKWMLKGDLYQKLDDDQSLMTGDATLISFYNQTQSQLIGQFKDINDANATLFDLDPAVRTNLDQNKQLLQQQMALLKTYTALLLGGTLTGSQITSAQASITGLQLSISNLITYNKTALDLAKNTRILNADNTKAVNDGLATSELIEQNEKDIHTIYLATIAKGIFTFTSSQATTILSVAEQCPMSGGRAVPIARGFYEMIDESKTYDDVTTCLQGGIVLRHTNDGSATSETSGTIKKQSVALFKPYFVPNPAKQNATLFYQLDNSKDGILYISNYLGEILVKLVLKANENSVSISTGSLANGIYHFKVISNGDEIGNGKFAVIK